jgi:excisionase family DNA binding protein
MTPAGYQNRTRGNKPPERVRSSSTPKNSDSNATPQETLPVQAEIIAVVESRRGAWSAHDLAELLGCSGKHIYALAKSGRMPHLRIDGMIRFDPAATGRWLRERFIAA